jgi:N-carbamoylputrescine amidase
MSKKSEVRVGLVQMICSESPAENLERSIEKIRSAAASGAQVICLQEVFNTQYPCQAEEHSRFELAEPIPGPTTAALQRLRRS